ncbi:MAG TPA: molybdopterin converting factor subunit 1 [Candidatus Latescibacteria bacterium]|nr:molybdopterin converting factor subunit 1 [Candidatus Latescibacterota bacterium]
MKLRVLFFAACREITGTRELEIEVADGSNVGDLRRDLGERFPALKRMGSALSAAVNADYCGDSVVLVEGDEVSFLPPVSGG